MVVTVRSSSRCSVAVYISSSEYRFICKSSFRWISEERISYLPDEICDSFPERLGSVFFLLAKAGVEGGNTFRLLQGNLIEKPQNSAVFVFSGRLKSQGAEAGRKGPVITGHDGERFCYRRRRQRFPSVGPCFSLFGSHEVERFCRDELARCLTGKDTAHVDPDIQFTDLRAFGEVELLQVHPEDVG